MDLVDGAGEISVTASVGLATQSGVEVDVRKLIGSADAALYEAKRGGKNRVVVARPSASRVEAGTGSQAKGPGRWWRK